MPMQAPMHLDAASNSVCVNYNIICIHTNIYNIKCFAPSTRPSHALCAGYGSPRKGGGEVHLSGFTALAPPGAPGNPSEARGVPHLGPGLVGVKPEVYLTPPPARATVSGT